MSSCSYSESSHISFCRGPHLPSISRDVNIQRSLKSHSSLDTIQRSSKSRRPSDTIQSSSKSRRPLDTIQSSLESHSSNDTIQRSTKSRRPKDTIQGSVKNQLGNQNKIHKSSSNSKRSLFDYGFQPVRHKHTLFAYGFRKITSNAIHYDAIGNGADPMAVPGLISGSTVSSDEPRADIQIANAGADRMIPTIASSSLSHCAGEFSRSSMVVHSQVKPAEALNNQINQSEVIQTSQYEAIQRSQCEVSQINQSVPMQLMSHPEICGLPKSYLEEESIESTESSSSRLSSSYCCCCDTQVVVVPPGLPWCTNKVTSGRKSEVLTGSTGWFRSTDLNNTQGYNIKLN